MARLKEKNKAQALRRKGKSIRAIAKELRVVKSSVSHWCRDIVLTSQQIEKLAQSKQKGAANGRLIAAEKKRTARIKEEQFLKNEGLKEIDKISERDLFIAGVGIYWSEGYTYSSGDQVGFTNSDPKMILLVLQWFKEICHVSKDQFSLAVRVNKIHQDRVEKIEKYWSGLAGIPLSQFNKTILIKSQSRKVYPNRSKYYGTLRITVRKSTRLRRRINGWIEGLSQSSSAAERRFHKP